MAAPPPSKRQRDEALSSDEDPKRHKSYSHILSLLEAEEDEPCQDVSSLVTTLQQHLSSDSILDLPFPPSQPATPPLKADGQENPPTVADSVSIATIQDYTTPKGDGDDDKEQVIRHLLEASDDELGIPNREDGGVGVEFDDGYNNGGDGFALCDGIWELEDEAANYYTLLQSELFM